MSASNTGELCDGIEALLAASTGGLREPMLRAVFLAQASPQDRGEVGQVGSRTDTLRAVLRRLRLERRAVLLDTGDRRWGTPAHLPPTGAPA